MNKRDNQPPPTTRYLVTRTHAGYTDEVYIDARSELEAAQQASKGIYRDLRVYPNGVRGPRSFFVAKTPPGTSAFFQVTKT